jgi:quercetin dioxygenase-like cupin family protein
LTEAQFLADAKRDGYLEILEREMQAGSNATEHKHAFDAHILVTAGEFTITIDGTARTYRAGETFAVPAGTPHAEAAGAEPVRYTVARRTAQS